MARGVYSIQFDKVIEKQLRKIPKEILKQIIEKIEKLKVNPRPENIESLHGSDKGLYRIRHGDYRIVYSIHDHILLICVVRIVNRREVYTKKNRSK